MAGEQSRPFTNNPDESLVADLTRVKSIFGDRAYCGLTRRFRPNDPAKLRVASQKPHKRQACPLSLRATYSTTSPERRMSAGCRYLHSAQDYDRQGGLPKGTARRPFLETT